MPLQLPKVNVKQVEGKASQDLTAHPWAGLKVRMILAARDQAGQTGLSEPYEFILPERNFTKPLAKAVVEQRKKLVREQDSASRVAMALDALTIGDERAIPDMPVYLALRDAYWRLDNDQSPESIASVVDQLWELALRIEDGNIPQAERDVKAAQEKLAEALKQGASPEEIQRLVDELRSALGRYLQALAEQAQQKGNLPEQKSQDGEQVVSDQELDKLLDNIEKLAKAGSKDMAEQMLSELKDILERLQTGTFSDNAKQQRASKMMKDLNDLVSKQQKLLDETFKAKREQSGQSAGRRLQCEPARAANGVRSWHLHGALRHAAGRGRGRRHVAGGQRKFTRTVRRPQQSAARPAAEGPAARSVRRSRPAPGRAEGSVAEPDRPLPHRRREPA